MIGEQSTGNVPGVRVTYTVTDGLSVEFNGQAAEVAVSSPEGLVLVAGPAVMREIEAAVINGYRNLLRGNGHLRERHE